jgi:hypothetical protein
MSEKDFNDLPGIQPTLRRDAWAESLVQKVYLTACDNTEHPSLWRRFKIWWWLRTLKRKYGDHFYDKGCTASSFPQWKWM